MTSLAKPYSLVVPGAHLMAAFVGQRDAHLRLIEAAFPEATVVARGNEIHVDGPQAEAVGRLCEELVVLLQQGQHLDEPSIRRSIDMMRDNEFPARCSPTTSCARDDHAWRCSSRLSPSGRACFV